MAPTEKELQISPIVPEAVMQNTKVGWGVPCSEPAYLPAQRPPSVHDIHISLSPSYEQAIQKLSALLASNCHQ